MIAGKTLIGWWILQPIGRLPAKYACLFQSELCCILRAGQSELKRQQSGISKRHFRTKRPSSKTGRHFCYFYWCGSINQCQNNILRSFHFWVNPPFKGSLPSQPSAQICACLYKFLCLQKLNYSPNTNLNGECSLLILCQRLAILYSPLIYSDNYLALHP